MCICSYGSFMNWIGLRALSWFLVQKELWEGKDPNEEYVPRDQWKPFDPHLLAEGEQQINNKNMHSVSYYKTVNLSLLSSILTCRDVQCRHDFCLLETDPHLQHQSPSGTASGVAGENGDWHREVAGPLHSSTLLICLWIESTALVIIIRNRNNNT